MNLPWPVWLLKGRTASITSKHPLVVLPVSAILACVPFSVFAQHALDFYTGKALFEKNWITAPASTAASDGLGPYYNARSCQQCHPGGGRGSRDASLVLHINDPVYGQQLQKFAVPGLSLEAEVVIEPLAQQPNSPPLYRIDLPSAGPMENPSFSARVAPALQTMAILEAIPESAITAMADADDKDDDGISGRVNSVTDSSGATSIGRFGWKASQTTLEDQVARALSLDLGIGNPRLPSAWGDCTQAQTDCLRLPQGNSPQHDNLEASVIVPELLLTYIRGLPARQGVDLQEPALQHGKALFKQIGCAGCHVDEIPGAEDLLQPYTDLLLHDMGPGLADDLEEAGAAGNEWRTAPLRGLGSGPGEYLHDGRAHSLQEAISWHDGEAFRARQHYRQLNDDERSDLSAFLNSL